MLESKRIEKLASPLKSVSGGVGLLFPELNWNLKKAGYKIDAIVFLSIALFFALMIFVISMLVIVMPLAIRGGLDILAGIAVAGVLGIMAFFYVMLIPNLKIGRKKGQIDKNLEYMLKDMQIQLTAGIPLFDIFVNVASGEYGECSVVCSKIIQDVHSGKSIVNVLDEYGLISPSEYMRRVFWQMVNALKTGSNVGISLKMISQEIREEKENGITTYSHELALWSLVYMIFVIVLPSMGITLILILSSFLGGATITESIFWLMLVAIVFFQLVFLSIIRNKRPDIN